MHVPNVLTNKASSVISTRVCSGAFGDHEIALLAFSMEKATMNLMKFDEVAIRTDADGRYRINDLHKASGGEKRNGPAYWMENQQTIDLIAELETTGIPVVSIEGRNGGTYVCKELVYAYAMWISPAFNLRVIQAFDALARGQIEEAQRIATRSQYRRDTKQLSAPMRDALRDVRAMAGKETEARHYINEFDMINRIVLGMPAKQYKMEHGLPENANLRDTLTSAELAAIADLEDVNRVLIDLGFDFHQRKDKLAAQFQRKHNKAVIASVLALHE